ncbi:putative leader peptide [Streptomyces sp. ALI-76-A]
MQCTLSVPRSGGQADLTKRRAVDLCRVAAMLCRTF